MTHDTETRRAPRSLFTDDERFLSRTGCRTLADRIFAMAAGGGNTTLYLDSQWRGNLRWSRNMVATGGDMQDTYVTITREIRGARNQGYMGTNSLTDDALLGAVRRAEAALLSGAENPDNYPARKLDVHPASEPNIWSDRTYNLNADARGKATADLMAPAVAAGVMSAGYLQVSAFGQAYINSDGLFRYFPYTAAQYTVTARDPKAAASGWAGVDFADWGKIDAAHLSQVALDKCVRSRNPVAIEPGRFTTILEPQAVCDLLAPVLNDAMSRRMAEQGGGPFSAGRGISKIGQQVLDARLSVSADPMDPDLGFVPFDRNGEPYVNVTWIDKGILKELEYDRGYAVALLGKDWALPNSRAFKLAGGTTSVDQMIANTKRGVLVTRFHNVEVVSRQSMLMNGTTRDGLWLIENGKIAKAIKNFRFTESPMFAFNNVEAVGVPQRVFRPDAPAVCPPILVRDFSFTGLSDAI